MNEHVHPLFRDVLNAALRPERAVDRLRNGGQLDLADQVEAEIRAAYAEGRSDEAEFREIDEADRRFPKE